MAESEKRPATFPNHIEDERKLAGLTQAELARQAGIEVTWFSRIESGRALASPEELDQIANALGGVPVSRLYDTPFLRAIGAAKKATREAAAS